MPKASATTLTTPKAIMKPTSNPVIKLVMLPKGKAAIPVVTFKRYVIAVGTREAITSKPMKVATNATTLEKPTSAMRITYL